MNQFACDETKLLDILTEACIPGSRHLLQAIKGLAEFADMMRFVLVNKTWRLMHIYCLRCSTVKESVLYIKLFEVPTMT